MLEFSIYLLYRAVTALINLLPLPALFVIGQFTGTLSWMMFPNYRRLALRNLEIAFGNEKSRSELQRLVWRHFRRLGSNLLCTVKMTAVPVERLAARVTLENSEPFVRLWRSGRPVVLVISHLAMWEIFTQVLTVLFPIGRICGIYQTLSNRFIDQYVHAMRERSGSELFERGPGGFQEVTTILRGGALVGILCDQHAGDQGVWVPFFGRLASTTTLPALMAKRSNAIMVSCGLYTEGLARWRMAFSMPVDARGDSVDALTAEMNALLESEIRRSPEDWFWVHNRWKTPRPNFLLARYKRGLFLPADVPPETLKRFRILIRASNRLEDNNLSVPVVQAIKRGRPDAHVTVAVPSAISGAWRAVPEVDEILPLEPDRPFASARAIRRGARFDVAVLFTNSLQSAFEVWLAGIPLRVGYDGPYRRFFLNQLIPKRARSDRPHNPMLHYLDIARELGAATEDVDLKRVGLIAESPVGRTQSAPAGAIRT